MKFVIRKVIVQEWKFDNHNFSHYEDKIYLNSYTYKEALRKISMICDYIEQQYNDVNACEYVTIHKWNVTTMLIPVSEKFKGQNNWINTENFSKYKVD